MTKEHEVYTAKSIEMKDYTLRSLNESCLLFCLRGEGDESSIRLLLSIFHTLKKSAVLNALGVVDLVPAYEVLAIHFPGNEQHGDEIKSFLEHTMAVEDFTPYRAGKQHTLPVCYDGPDLATVAEVTGLTVQEVTQLHAEPDYFVAMIGFKPHFPYLVGLNPALTVPRLDNPRQEVPAGSVGIGGDQTGVYPVPSPGGWRVIGRTDPALLLGIEPGDQVRFVEDSVS